MKKNLLVLLAGMAFPFLSHSQAPTSAAVHPATSNPSNQHVIPSGPLPTVQTVFPNYGWSNKPALPGGRWATGPVFSKNCNAGTDTGLVYLIAGYDASFANTAVNTIYNTTTGTFRSGAPIPDVRGQVTPIKVGGKIYVIGGYGASSFSPVSTNSIYDIATNTWTTGAAMPVAVGDYAAGTYMDSLIYFVGGYNGSGDVNDVQIYNTFSDTWAVGTVKTGTAVAGCRMGISGNNIVFVGGYSQTLAAELADAYLGVINPATPTTITWSPLPAYPGGTVGRLAGGVSFENTGSVYFGGGDPTGQGTLTLNSVYAYNTTTSTWDSGPNMPVSVSNIMTLAGIVHNDSLFLVTMGGYDGSVITTTHSWLNLGPAAPLPSAQADVAICIGSSTTLTASNALTYSWSPGTNLSSTTTASTVANPTSTITYTVTMTKAYGCPVTDPVTVTVNPLPVVTANSTASAVCSGSPVTLSGGGATTYTWTGSVTDNVAFTPAVTDTYTVTGTDGNGCQNSATTTVTVNPLPAVVANTTAAAVCDGSPVTLSGSGATSYSWTGSVTDNVAFTPTVTDTYTVTGTDGNGCQNTDMVTVTVNALPAVIANTTATAICDGSPVTLSGSGATSYTWTGSVTDNVAFTPTVTDTYTVTGTDANGCQNTDMVTVTLNTLPTVIANATATAVCDGSPVTLSGSGATSYTWTGSVTDNVPFIPTVSDTFIVTGTNGNGCTNNDTIMITVNPLPTVVANSTSSAVCAGSAVTLTGSGASTYSWTGSVTDGVSFTPAVTDSYTVTGTDGNGCSNTDSITVTVNPLPAVTASSSAITMCIDDASAILTGTPAGGTWSGTGVSGSTFNPMTAGLGAQTATYFYTDTNGCDGNAAVTITVNACTGVAEAIFENSFAVYPNPNNGTFTITAGVNMDELKIEVLDLQGRVVFASVENQVQSGFTKQIQLENAAEGIYMVRMTGNGEQQIIKISVQR